MPFCADHSAPIHVYAAWPDHTEVLHNLVIRFEICSDHGMRSHVPALLSEREKIFVFKFINVFESEASRGYSHNDVRHFRKQALDAVELLRCTTL